MIKKITKDITPNEYKIINHFFPGPITIILKKNNLIPDIVSAGSDTIGIRMPNNIIAQKIIQFADVPIATPSANISGKPSGINLKSIIADFQDNVDFYVDGGESKLKQASTIVKLVNNEPIILREGAVSKDEINNLIKSIN